MKYYIIKEAAEYRVIKVPNIMVGSFEDYYKGIVVTTGNSISILLTSFEQLPFKKEQLNPLIVKYKLGTLNKHSFCSNI